MQERDGMCAVEEAMEVIIENAERKACIVRIKVTLIKDIERITEIVDDFTRFEYGIISFEARK
jgi:hypothetical protein